MSLLARILARFLWGKMLWLMRRPWMKRLQQVSQNLFPEPKRSEIRSSWNRQNRWARRVGLPLLTVSMNLLLASILLTTAYFLVLGLYEGGFLAPPSSD